MYIAYSYLTYENYFTVVQYISCKCPQNVYRTKRYVVYTLVRRKTPLTEIRAIYVLYNCWALPLRHRQ